MRKNQSRIDSIHHSYTIQSVLNTHRKVIVCPLPFHVHHNHTPSFSIYWQDGYQHFHCHGNCNLRGDVIDLMGYLKIRDYNPRNPNMVAKAMDLLENKFIPQIVIPPKVVKLKGSEWIDFVPPGTEVIEYARSRGLMPETLEKFNIGQSGFSMSIPCFHEKRLMGVKMRDIRTRDKARRYWQLEGSRAGIYNYDAVAYKTIPLVMVKGEIPVMLLDQYGIAACAPTGGEGSWEEGWLIALEMNAPRIVVGDNDGPGRKLGARRAELLKAKLVFPPERYKDIDEWLLHEPGGINIIQRWLDEA